MLENRDTATWVQVISLKFCLFYPRKKRPGTHSVGDWAGRIVGLEVLRREKSLSVAENGSTTPRMSGQ